MQVSTYYLSHHPLLIRFHPAVWRCPCRGSYCQRRFRYRLRTSRGGMYLPYLFSYSLSRLNVICMILLQAASRALTASSSTDSPSCRRLNADVMAGSRFTPCILRPKFSGFKDWPVKNLRSSDRGIPHNHVRDSLQFEED